ncbi:GntR family transcriptional regulator [Lactobacillus sp. CBA3606]|uniref:GntR family transcriptional regulator n=1 Tax=Lactobacillus sp. CBA3606 TaxID=2099789 RepID=UPI000CFB9FD4|nr:GntR family transcriptional regulator [Lactobacillus sp. CBA3606]AVK64065.1 GntR family transcriptional regulator [Lactobacillus sp. CBA3606]
MSELAKHKQIELDLLQKIKDGTYPPQTLIPREVDLMAHYGVSRPTVRQAIQSLVSQGLLEKRKRRGTMVKQPKIAQAFTQIVEGYNDEMSNKGLLPQTKVLLLQREAANVEVADNLRLNVGEAVYKLVRLRYANYQPVVLITSYIPVRLQADLLAVDFTQASLYDTLSQAKHEVTHVRRRLDVLTADETVADLLNIAQGDPLFYFHTQGFTASELPVEYSVAKYRGDVNYFVMNLQRA